MEGPFVYHRVVKDFRGTTLYPLNRLKEIYPDAYAEHVKKYAGRERLLESPIPPLHCLWNDVLHFTAVHPKTLSKNLEGAGFDTSTMELSRTWFQIPVSLFEPENTTTCLYRRDAGIVPRLRDFQPFDPGRMEEYRKVPPETLAYYKEKFDAGERPLLFHLVPHILYKGNLDIRNLDTVDL